MADTSYRDEIAAEIIKRIEAGTAPWQKPWRAGELGARPFNPVSGTVYRGLNDVWLSMQGRADPRWMTYKQATEAGVQVRKGEKSTALQYWRWVKPMPRLDEAGQPILGQDGKPETVSVRLDRPELFYAKVFNAEQIDGLAPWVAPAPAFEPVARAEALMAGAGVPIHHDQADRAFYSPASDAIHLPPVAAFREQASYYATALHELGHATGHAGRLARSFGPFGSEGYAREELRAEIASYMLARDLGISFDPSNHAAYVQSWLKVLRQDRNEIFVAARDAETIKTWVSEPEKRPELERAAQQGLAARSSSAAEAQELAESREAQALEKAQRAHITVPFAERAEAKAAGARWDDKAKSWYVPEGADPAAFARWNTAPEHPAARPEAVPSVEEYEKKIRAVLADTCLPQTASDYLRRISAAYLGYDLPFHRDIDPAHVWHHNKVSPGEADKLLDRAAFAGNWPVKAAEALGVSDATAEVASFARTLSFVDWDGYHSDDDDIRQRAEQKISAVVETMTDVAARSPRHAELISVICDWMNPRYPEETLPRGGYVPSDLRTTDLVAQLAHDPVAATFSAHGVPAKLIRQSRTEEQAMAATPAPRTYIAVPFAEKDAAKTAGARWDRKAKSWYVPDGMDPGAFARWAAEDKAPAPDLPPEKEFAAFLKANDLVLDGDPEMDGKWHRVPTRKDKGKEKSGSYRGFLDGRPAGQAIAGWNAKAVRWVATGVALTDEERARLQAEAAQARAKREAERLAQAEKAARAAYGVWQNLPGAATAGNCPYLARKGVGGHGVKVDGDGHMVVPARDVAGKLWTLQFVSPEGKRWIKGSHKVGCMHVIDAGGKGTLDALARSTGGPVVIAEGYATAARIFEATGRPVVVAFDSGNLQAVAEAVLDKLPGRHILIAADNDHANKLGNVGSIKAAEAARAVGGRFVAPQFTAAEKARGLTDFDDLGKARGNDAVRHVIESALAPARELERGVA